MSLVDRFTHAVIRNSGIVLAVVAGFTLFFTYQYFQQSHNNHIEIFFEDDDPLYRAYGAFQETFGNEEYGMVALESDGLFSNDGFTAIRDLTAALENIDGVERVLSLTAAEEFHGGEDFIELRKIIPDGRLTDEEIQAARDRSFANQFASQHLISPSGTMTAFYVELEKLKEKEKRRAVLAMIDTARRSAAPGISVYCSGSSIVEAVHGHQRVFRLFPVRDLSSRHDGGHAAVFSVAARKRPFAQTRAHPCGLGRAGPCGLRPYRHPGKKPDGCPVRRPDDFLRHGNPENPI